MALGFIIMAKNDIPKQCKKIMMQFYEHFENNLAEIAVTVLLDKVNFP